MSLSVDSLDQSLPIIGILLCTYNGEKYLDVQLRSIANQTYKNWRIFASDDGSTDRTIEILKVARRLYGEDRLDIFEGPKQGPTENFLSLIRLMHQECDYFAFCDQDDIWYENKLSRALNFLGSSPSSLPVLYCSSSSYISESGSFIQNSYIFQNSPSFRNALVQSIAGGNTMIFNQAVANLLASTPICKGLVAHDWWTYILVTAFSGKVYYDPIPSVYYRQHSEALVGENQSIKAKITRIRKLLDGKYKSWNIKNLETLTFFSEKLSAENQRVLAHFKKIRSKYIILRLHAYIYAGVRRQTFMGNLALFIGVLLNRV